jgi:hypothetical protein
MKNFIIGINKMVFAFTLWYLIGCFIAWDMNIAHWSFIGRIFYVFFSLYTSSKLINKQ